MADPLRRYVLSGAGFFGVSLLGRAASVAAVFLLARSLDPLAMGTFAFLQATATIALTIGTLNLGQVLNIELAHGRVHRRRSENAMLVLILGGVCALSIAAALALLIVTPNVPASKLTILFPFTLFVAATALQTLTQSVAYARGMPNWAAATAAVSAAGACLGIALLEPRDVQSAMLISTTSIGTGTALLTWQIFRNGLLQKWRLSAGMLRVIVRKHGRRMAAFSVLTLLSGLVLQAALWAIQRHLVVTGNAAENATYAIGLQFFNVVLFLPSLYAPLLIRRLRTSALPAAVRRDVLLAVAACTVLCLAGLVVLAQSGNLVNWLVPAKYAEAQTVIWWATLAGALMFIKFPFSVYFQVSFSAVPDALANVLAAGAIALSIYGVTMSSTALASSQLRAAACLLQLICVGGAFALARGRRADFRTRHG